MRTGSSKIPPPTTYRTVVDWYPAGHPPGYINFGSLIAIFHFEILQRYRAYIILRLVIGN